MEQEDERQMSVKKRTSSSTAGWKDIGCIPPHLPRPDVALMMERERAAVGAEEEKDR
jgi:hypothetical protein